MAARAIVINAEDRFSTGAPPLDVEEGSGFGYHERMFLTWRDGKVFDYGDWHARDIEEMLSKDYKSRQLEQVQSGPLEGAEFTIAPIKGDNGESDWINEHFLADQFSGGPETPLALVVSQMTSAISMRKAFFELVFTQTDDGKIGYKKIAFRPATTCRTMRTPQGSLLGFEQDPWYVGGVQNVSQTDMIEIPLKRAFIYVHGQRRDPINGVSDMDVPYWCFKTRQKILFLWFQFAEQAALPRITVTAQDAGVARQVAAQIAKLKNSGVMPLAAPQGADSVAVQALDVSGKGGDQFERIVTWLDQAAANSILAGFTNLTDVGKDGGSRALSSDASDFYLQSLESKAREIEREIRRGLIAPLVYYNFGPKAKVPQFKMEPLNAEDKTPQVTMLTDLMHSRDPALVPDEFIGELATQVGNYFGMDGTKIRTAFDKAATEAKAKAAAMSQAGASAPGQAVAGVAGAVSAAGAAMRTKGATLPGVGGTPQLPRGY